MDNVLKFLFLDFPEIIILLTMVHIATDKVFKLLKILGLSFLIALTITIVEFLFKGFPESLPLVTFIFTPLVTKLFYNDVKFGKIIVVLFAFMFSMFAIEVVITLPMLYFFNKTITELRSSIFLWIAFSIPVRLVEFSLLKIVYGTRDDIKEIINYKITNRRSKNEKIFNYLDSRIFSKIGL